MDDNDGFDRAPYWEVRALGAKYRVMLRWDVPVDDTTRTASTLSVEWMMRRAFNDFWEADKLRQLAKHIDWDPHLWQKDNAYVLRILLRALERGRLVALELPDEQVGVPSHPTPPATREAPASDAQSAWFQAVLQDENGDPIPGLRCELKLPDGQLRQSLSSKDGSIDAETASPGTCLLKFHNIIELRQALTREHS